MKGKEELLGKRNCTSLREEGGQVWVMEDGYDQSTLYT
jgi:hypothetical protein